ncbi:putative reverse transcriptase domain-containing protein [Tanacetum coccineum]
MKGAGKEMSKYLSDFQFGVGVSGGAEAVLHSVNRVLSEYHNDGSLAMLTVVFSNAINLVDRSALLHEVRVRCPSIFLWVDFLYGQASRLYIGDTHIWSATGVQQGGPLGPLLFALILHPLLHKIKDICKLLLHAWYLDDGTTIGDSEEVAKVLDIIKVSGPGLGLELNIKKTKIFWPSCNGMKLRKGLFPVDIRRPSSGVKLLRGAVSRDADFISGLAMRRSTNDVDLMSLLPQLHDPQSELLLLRSCMGIAKLFFGLSTCQPIHMEEAALFFDKGFRGSIENIVVCGGPFFVDLQWRLASLPIRFGGLGFGICGMDDDYVSALALACLRDTILSFDFSGFTNKDTAPSKVQQTLTNVLFSEMFKDMEVHFDVTMRQKAAFECLRAPHAQDFLLAIPIDRRAGISAKKEAPVNFLTDPSDGRSTLRPADFLIFGWVGRKHACVDLTTVSPLVGLSSRGFTAGQAALKAASCKVTKHEKACIENQHVFIPFAFDTFGFLAPEAVELLSRVQWVMHNNVMIPKFTDVVLNVLVLQFKKD